MYVIVGFDDMTLLNIALYCSKAETRGVQSHFHVKPNYIALFWVVGWVVVLTISDYVTRGTRSTARLHKVTNSAG